MKVGVLRGGWSLERSVSLRSGARIEGALRRLGHEPVSLDLDRELAPRLAERDLAAVIVAVHGAGGDDGAAQGLLDAFDVPYTGSGPAAAAIAFDKPLSKRLLRAAGIPTPPFVSISSDALRDLGLLTTLPELLEVVGTPVVVKPARGGSALGIRFARDPDEVSVALSVALAHDREALIERFVEGRDLAVSVIEREGELVALPVVEARPRERDFYDFEARYTPGATVFDAPAQLDGDAAAEAQRLSVSTCALLGLRGPARIDLMLDRDGAWWVLEANAVPGMTDTSLLPLAAAASGMDFDSLVAALLEAALRA
ncbi:MAG TPA: D-alanine--D-alanine ligase [Gaiellales bacterium]|jgi:D-alanine-D-alanine ligase